MKIGILTHQYVNNYGAFLQAFALRKAVSEQFPDAEVEIIDYVNVKHWFINTCGWFRFYRDRESVRGWLQKIRVPILFSAARKRYLCLSRLCLFPFQINRKQFIRPTNRL